MYKMLLLIGVTLSCLILSVQPQGAYYPAYQNPENIYFPGASNAVTLSIPDNSQQPNAQILEQIFGRPTRHNAVEIEKSNEVLAATTVEQARRPNDQGLRVTQSPQNRDVLAQASSNGRFEQAAPIRPSQPQPGPNPAGYNRHLYSVTNFGINLLKNVNAVQSGNLVMSPFSITALLALLQQGSSGQTQAQITSALGMTPEVSARAYSAISADIRGRSSRNILKTANAVFVGDNFNLNTEFKLIAQRNFDSEVAPLSFNAPDQASQIINRWVAVRTNHKIERLISPENLGPATQLVLVNAIYFKGLWSTQFNPNATRTREFYLANGQQKNVPFMRARRKMKAGVDSTTNAQVVVLPFENEEYTMMVIVPSQQSGIRGTLDSLTDARLLSYLSFAQVDTQLELPKFTARADTDLSKILEQMGMTNMFGPYAELSGLGTYRTLSPQISSAVHSAVFQVDEFGASASAATSFAGVALSYDEPTLTIHVERPFITVLWDTASAMPLFMAKIENPEA